MSHLIHLDNGVVGSEKQLPRATVRPARESTL